MFSFPAPAVSNLVVLKINRKRKRNWTEKNISFFPEKGKIDSLSISSFLLFFSANLSEPIETNLLQNIKIRKKLMHIFERPINAR